MSEIVYLLNGKPNCQEHGAMNEVSKYGMWRCLECHVGYDEKTRKILKDSTEGFRKKPPEEGGEGKCLL